MGKEVYITICFEACVILDIPQPVLIYPPPISLGWVIRLHATDQVPSSSKLLGGGG